MAMPCEGHGANSIQASRALADDVERSMKKAPAYLVVSPYTSRSHLLDLTSVSKPNQFMALALTAMEPIRDDYATSPYADSFDWAAILARVRSLADSESYYWHEQTFYAVIFRSQVLPTTDRSHLGALDERSHAEAMESGGLLKYWFGKPNSDGRNLATCIWRESQDAKRGSTGGWHKRAMKATIGLYSEWKFERWKLTVGAGAKHLDLVEWDGE